MAITKSQATGIAPELAKTMPLQDQSNVQQVERANPKTMHPCTDAVKDEGIPATGQEPPAGEAETDPAKTGTPNGIGQTKEQKQEQESEANLVNDLKQKPGEEQSLVQVEEKAEASPSTQEGKPAHLACATGEKPDPPSSNKTHQPANPNQCNTEKNVCLEASSHEAKEETLEKQTNGASENLGVRPAQAAEPELEVQPALKKPKESS
mmetsp:Transcript_8434/g.30071  ORF Transcript_8434/g.30071 Transcript_8434/m.30071 type:complete len:208 (-) Transcript_8434:456-1079(-)